MSQKTSAGAGGTNQNSIDTVERKQLDMIRADPSLRGLRGQHPKQHGCVQARFEVLADLPDELKVGLFAKPATYTAYIRFSNSREKKDDTKPDVHGMAIKLTGVDGRKISDDEASTHDFILVDHPVFFIKTADDYADFFNDQAKFINKLKEDGRKGELLAIAALRAGHRQESPLTARYWSQVPYAFGADGGSVCRYSTIPHDGNLVASVPEPRGPNYLREAMVLHLTEHPAGFDFTVQVRKDTTPAVIDDPTVEWDEPFKRVAVITIPAQAFDTREKQDFGESLSYSPWHALPEHRPVGQINEVRKKVYIAGSTLRHETRPALRGEPTGTEDW